jgi:hypothetical protein
VGNCSDQTCGCCDGVTLSTPQDISNRPGLDFIAYRNGTWAGFRESMVARLSASDLGALAPLTSRDHDDYTIALLDAWSMVGDIVTFYQERLFSEAMLRTARQPWSLTELARLVGYAPKPGVAAAAKLVFTLDTTSAAPTIVNLKLGLRVQSTPGQDETAVTYETTQAIAARPAWNAIRPRLGQPTVLSSATRTLWLPGASTGLLPGNGIYFEGSDGPVFSVVQAVQVRRADKVNDPDSQDLSVVTLAPLGTAPLYDTGFDWALSAPALNAPASEFLGQTLTEKAFRAQLIQQHIDERAVIGPFQALEADPVRVLVFKKRMGVFGNAAPTWASLPPSLIGVNPVYGTDSGGHIVITGTTTGPYHYDEFSWADGDLTVLDPWGAGEVFLDGVESTEQAGDMVVLRDDSTWGIYSIGAVAETSLSAFAVTAKTSRLTLDSATGFSSFGIRSTSVYVQSGWMALANEPITGVVTDASATALELNGWSPGLTVGQTIAVSGVAVGGPSTLLTELVDLASVEHIFTADGRTRITLDPGLSHSFVRSSVRINANVAPATHGSTLNEVLGGGSAPTPFQTFATRDGPLTFLPAATPSGGESTLQVRVNDVLWHEADNLLAAGPTDRVYVTRADPAAHTVVQFGDGLNGSRLPTGTDNVRAVYRKGVGLAGRVRAAQLNIPLDRPLGLQGVINPLAAEGGADPETIDCVRRNAPLGVRTLDRAVGLTDYEDFAAAFGGIAKAQAARLLDIAGPFVLVTVAAEGGAQVLDTGDLHKWLGEALADSGDPYARFKVVSYRPATFRLAAMVTIDPDYDPTKVLPAVEAQLRAAFSFDARAFAQPVWESEVMAQVHTIAGVVAVDVDRLYRDIKPDGTPGAVGLSPGLASEPQRRATDGTLLGGELLMINPGPLDYLEIDS